MSENDDDETGDGTEPLARNSTDLTPARAYELKDEQGMSFREIAGMYDCSHTTAKRKFDAFKEGLETGREEVTSNPSAFDLTEAIDDDEPENTPYETEYPCCGETASKPSSPGVHACPNCGTKLEWSEGEL